jgi:hypothetical protein
MERGTERKETASLDAGVSASPILRVLAASSSLYALLSIQVPEGI